MHQYAFHSRMHSAVKTHIYSCFREALGKDARRWRLCDVTSIILDILVTPSYYQEAWRKNKWWKSKTIVFSKSPRDVKLTINGNIEQSQSFKYLGHIVSNTSDVYIYKSVSCDKNSGNFKWSLFVFILAVFVSWLLAVFDSFHEFCFTDIGSTKRRF